MHLRLWVDGHAASVFVSAKDIANMHDWMEMTNQMVSAGHWKLPTEAPL